jgi:predicted DNA-binding transcriptional regulator AlpA
MSTATKPARKPVPLLERELLRANELAELLGMSRSGAYQGVRDGSIPRPIQAAGSTRWRRREIEDWVIQGCPTVSAWTWQPTMPVRLDMLIQTLTTSAADISQKLAAVRELQAGGAKFTNVRKE